MGAWNTFDTSVTLPLLAPGDKLSEVELLKWLLAYQWESIARLFGMPSRNLHNESNQRLYGSVLQFELDFGAHHGPERFGECARLLVRNRVRTFAQRFVEGLFVLDDQDVSDAALAGVDTLQALRSQNRPYAYMVNAFVTRAASNTSLTVFKPAGITPEPDALAEPPEGMTDHAGVQRTGEIPPFDDAPPGLLLPTRRPGPIRYRIVPESDLNGARLVYFARYVAMTTFAERIFAERHLAQPLSNPLVEALSTERRRIYYFANAAPKDTIELTTRSWLVPAEPVTSPAPARPLRTPFRLVFRMDLRRASDQQLIASSLVRKALNIPASAKSVLVEAERFLHQLQN
jgi:probable biosynthetic protein (TIGR04098 family)